ncbi:MAG: aldo/keto reductase [Natronomonas sp.]
MSRPEIPAPGFGTSGLEGQECVEAVDAALEAGYRHIDTAQMYDNEAEVGEALAESGVDREAVFLATKVHPDSLAPEDVRRTTEASLDRLGVDAVDLLYVHWPIRAYDAEGTLRAFDELREAGLTRHVGVSNFTPELLEEARELLDAPIAAHQLECHPLLPQSELAAIARETGHRLVAYSPLAQGELLDHPVVESVAEELGASPAQAVLAWHLDRDIVPIPKARGEHVRENIGAKDVEFTDEARTRLDSIDERRRVVDPDDAPWN